MRVESSDASKRITLGYARVSSHDQKDDLMRQKEVLQLFCAQRGWSFEIIEDLGSGMNYRKKGLIELLNRLLSGEIERLVLTHKERLLRFGEELIFQSVKSSERKLSLSIKVKKLDLKKSWPKTFWKSLRSLALVYMGLVARRISD